MEKKITIEDIEKEIRECGEVERINRTEVGAAWLKN